MDEDVFRTTTMDSQNQKSQPRIVYNDLDVQVFRRCLASYMSNDYQTAVGEIRSLRSRYSDVVHIQLNELIASFYHQRCLNVDEFLVDLRDAMTKAYGPAFETTRLRDLTQVVYMFNYALILCYLMRYNQSLSIMKTIEKYFDTLEDALVRDSCFLLIELHVSLHQVAEAMQIISYLEEEFEEQSGVRIQLPEHFRNDTLLFDENSQLIRPMPGFKAKLQLYKVKVANCLRMQDLSRKESRGLIMAHGINALTIFSKGQSEFTRGNHSKAIKHLNHLSPFLHNQSSSTNSDYIPSLFYNNLACIHSAMGKPTIASVYFNKALDENTKAMQTIPMSPSANNGQQPQTQALYNQIPLQSIASSRFAELIYNLGTQLLIAGQPVQAFPLLVEAAQTYHQNPRVWLRMAECCVIKYKNDVMDPLHRRKPTRYMVKGFVGSGKYRKLLLSPVLLPYQKQLSQRKVAPNADMKKDPSEPSLTMEFARMCLVNALAVVNRQLAKPTGVSSGNMTASFIDNMHALPPSGVSSSQEMLTLKAYILVNLAFVSNSMWDYVGGVDYSRQAEALPEIPGVIRFLLSAYASEGLMRLNRPSEAAYYLSVSYINNVFRQMKEDMEKEGQVSMSQAGQNGNNGNVSPGTPLSTTSTDGSSEISGGNFSGIPPDDQSDSYSQPNALLKTFLHIPNDYLRRKPLYARNLLGYNHAVWLAMNGDLEASYEIGETLKSASNADTITRARATQLCIYIRFRQGRNIEGTKLITDDCTEWKERLAKDFDEDERKLKMVRESQGIPWPFDP